MNNTTIVSSIDLKGFRCFETKTVSFPSTITVLEGPNGSGKTSVIEALYYACYLRSFKDYISKDLIQFDAEGFFMRLHLANAEMSEILQVGFSKNKKLVRLNNEVIGSYQKLNMVYRMICVAEHDLSLVQDSPEYRRAFIDQALSLEDDTYSILLRKYRTILSTRNEYLFRKRADTTLYQVYTETLWDLSRELVCLRMPFLKRLEAKIALLTDQFFTGTFTINFSYKSRLNSYDYVTVDEFLHNKPDLHQQEIRYGRTLFGAHLDDIEITLNGIRARVFASRGQQKAVVLLIKIAQALLLIEQGKTVLCALDDFMTDFDEQKICDILKLLSSYPLQLILTCPSGSMTLKSAMTGFDHSWQSI